MEATEVCRAVKIYVTQRHIQRGVPRVCGGCPVALAILDKIPFLGGIVVGEGGIFFFRDKAISDPCFEIICPIGVSRFVSDFDSGKPVSPFSFFLFIPEDVFAWDTQSAGR